MSLSIAGIWRVRLSHTLVLFSLSWWPGSSHSSTVCVPITSTLRGTTAIFFFFWSTHRQECQSCSPSGRHTACPEKLELGTLPSWLSRPLATVTDVLFNTRAGGGLGWSEYKLAHCLQEGECTANVAAKYFTCKLIPLQLGLTGHLRPPCYFTCFSSHKRTWIKWGRHRTRPICEHGSSVWHTLLFLHVCLCLMAG